MNIRINGTVELIDRAGSIAELIAGKGLHPERVVVEHNRRMVPRGEWPDVMLKEDDSIEIVSFVGGG